MSNKICYWEIEYRCDIKSIEAARMNKQCTHVMIILVEWNWNCKCMSVCFIYISKKDLYVSWK